MATPEPALRPCLNYYVLGKCRTSWKRCKHTHDLSHDAFLAAMTKTDFIAQVSRFEADPAKDYTLCSKPRMLEMLRTHMKNKQWEAQQLRKKRKKEEAAAAKKGGDGGGAAGGAGAAKRQKAGQENEHAASSTAASTAASGSSFYLCLHPSIVIPLSCR